LRRAKELEEQSKQSKKLEEDELKQSGKREQEDKLKRAKELEEEELMRLKKVEEEDELRQAKELEVEESMRSKKVEEELLKRRMRQSKCFFSPPPTALTFSFLTSQKRSRESSETRSSGRGVRFGLSRLPSVCARMAGWTPTVPLSCSSLAALV
jgi:hypothetical protein